MTENQHHRAIDERFEYGRKCFHKPDGVEAVKALKAVVDLDPGYRHPDGDSAYFYLGKINEMEGRIEDAIVFYTRALALDEWDEESRIGRGSCYTVARRHTDAIEDFTKLLRLPDNRRKVPKKNLLYVIAENYRQLEDWGQAIFWAERALNAEPGNERHQALYRTIASRLNE